MRIEAIILIGVAGALGSLARWGLGNLLNPLFPSVALGTLAVNLLGGFFMGGCIALIRHSLVMSELLRLTLITGFLGGLTTFSTFTGETLTLLIQHQYFFFACTVVLHVLGSLAAAYLGLQLTKLIIV